MSDCYNESYEDHIKKTDFLENKLYLEDKTQNKKEYKEHVLSIYSRF